VSVRAAGTQTPTMERKVAQIAEGRPSEADQVLSWRREWLERAGYCRSAARTLAARRDVDLHLALTLPRNGCPHNTALRILL
jgi:hypothetical protein